MKQLQPVNTGPHAFKFIPNSSQFGWISKNATYLADLVAWIKTCSVPKAKLLYEFITGATENTLDNFKLIVPPNFEAIVYQLSDNDVEQFEAVASDFAANASVFLKSLDVREFKYRDHGNACQIGKVNHSTATVVTPFVINDLDVKHALLFDLCEHFVLAPIATSLVDKTYQHLTVQMATKDLI